MTSNIKVWDGFNQQIRKDSSCVGTITRNVCADLKRNGQGIIEGGVDMEDRKYRIRKLTPKECWRLMGVKDEDYEKVAKNQSNSSLYHLAGDSIVTSCLMALFGQMTDIDYKEKIKLLSESLRDEKENDKTV